jgi:hypothetical protein
MPDISWRNGGLREPAIKIHLPKSGARVDYVNSLQETLEGQAAASEEVRAEFKALVDQCQAALEGRTERYGD